MALTASTLMILIAIRLAGMATTISLSVLLTARRRPTSMHNTLPNEAQYRAACVEPVERLSFTESLDPIQFVHAAEAATYEALRDTWQSTLGDGATVILNGVRLLHQKPR